MGTMGQGRWDLVFPSGAPERVGDMFATAVVADAVRGHDPDLAQTVETCRDWNRGYRTIFRAMTALGACSSAHAAGIAADGLACARGLLRFVTEYAAAPLDSFDLAAVAQREPLETGLIRGAAEPAARLEVPYRGGLLAEEALRRQLTDWRQRGIVEPGFATALERVIDHPEWLSLRGFRVVVAGAGELAPLRPLLRWGADVIAVARPGPARWRELEQLARAGAGVLRYPISPGPRPFDGGPGADITTQFPALLHWLRAGLAEGPRPVFGGYAHRFGPGGVRLAAAIDVLAEDVLARRPDAALAVLGSVTDCYAVPESVVADAHQRLRHRGRRGPVQDLLRLLTGSSLYQPNYQLRVTDAAGELWSVADAMVPAEGPDHVLAHRIQRWRGVRAHATGRVVSCAVAPLVRTRSLVAQPRLAAAYAGAHRFGIEIFEAETARTLLAAKLVADLCAPSADRDPEGLFAHGAAHSGLWRQPFEPRSILPIAALAGRLPVLRPRS
ncbi:NAD(P)-dependent oxidoreductase [Nocardia sp. NPDC127579]|uniref:NAD(P)-dependent oxidoreductase n=1 Tax=Nocardia sp. NPDC127579 TaxID=3345402 RepID=UPI003626CA93